MAVKLDQYQLAAVEKLKTGSVLQGGVGSGKSRAAIAYFYGKVCGGKLRLDDSVLPVPARVPRDLYIITTAKKRDSLDWEQEAVRFGLSTDRELSRDGIKVHVDSWNNIAKYEEVADAFFIFDEQRLVGSGVWVKAFYKIAKKNGWILLSATPGDTWLDYIPLFVANGFYKNSTDFKRQHVVYNRFAKYAKVERYLETGRLMRHRLELLVEMPVVKHTRRHDHNIIIDYDRARMDRVVKERWNVFTEEPIRDIGEMIRIARRVANEDGSRYLKLLELHKEHPKMIVFYNFNYELHILRGLRDDHEITIAEWNGHKHEDLPTGDSWVYLVQYQAGAEGWNCVDTDTTVFYSLPYAYRVLEQCKGRIDRRNTPFTDLHYFFLISLSQIDASIRKTLKAKRNFQKTDFKGVAPF